ncbi:MAG: hypothetical protein GC179_18015 [Anaerolineaceae bacterium]|nr:hypothetical protein [Anaerolineaceae bacterium]
MALVNDGRPALLMVEGKEDIRFFNALIKKLNLENIQVSEYEGKNQMRRAILALKNEDMFLNNIIALGVVRDADSDAAGAFQSITSAFKNAGLQVPKKPLKVSSETGKLTDPQTMAMVVPPNKLSGMLEDVCFESVGDETELINCVNQYFSCLSEKHESHVIPKAKLQVYLAAKEPEMRLGEAAAAGYWNWDHSVFEPIKAFLRQLSSISTT